MKRALVFFLLFAAAPLLAVETDDCRQYQQLVTLYEIRSLMLERSTSSYDVGKVIDRRIDQLRGPLPEGGFRAHCCAPPPT